MKLNIVPSRQGVQWVRQGFAAFVKQPLGMVGLFFMFMAIMTVATVVPFIGSVIALVLMPAATLGLMAAAQSATAGKFPTPGLLLTGFRQGRAASINMLILGALYAAGFLLMMAITTLVDGGQFASLYLLGGKITDELLASASFVGAVWLALALYVPLSMLFWHAPALVHWHGVSPVKSVFFSAVACLRNGGAYMVYGLAWAGVFAVAMVAVTVVAGLTGQATLLAVLFLPVAMLILAVFFTSIYFTFCDCFAAPPAP